MKKVNKMNFLLEETSKWLLSLGLIISMGACSDNDSDENVPNPGHTPLTDVQVAPRNPYLASEHYSITHFNSAQTDAFPYAVKDGIFTVNPENCASTWSGPVNLMTLSSTSPDYMWGMSSDRVSYINVKDGKFERIVEAELPDIKKHTKEELEKLTADYSSLNDLTQAATDILGQMPQMSMANGCYVLCDKDNYVYINAGRKLSRYRLKNASKPEEGIMLDNTINLASNIANSRTLVGVSMTFDGHLIVAAQRCLLMLDRGLTTIEDTYTLPTGQILTNSVSVDENSVYVASNSTEPNGKGLMQRIICKNGKFSTDASEGAWQASYDGGPAAPCIKLGYGTGSTPTLMGFGSDEDKLVVITDGSKRMKLAAFWRDEIPTDAKVIEEGNPRLAGVFEVSCGLPVSTEWVQSEQSVVVGGYEAFVVNNIKETAEKATDKIIGVLAIGPLLEGPKGVECVRWNVKDNKWEALWSRSDISSISMIPAVSTASDMVFVNGWYDNAGWKITGLDWATGKTRHQVNLGKSNRGNGAYAILQYFPNGDLLFNSVAGPFRAPLK